MARIHYEIPEDLHRRAKTAAAMRGITLKALVERGLELAIAEGPIGPADPAIAKRAKRG